MLTRSRLVLLDQFNRGPLRLLQEFDEKHREIERHAKANPDDPHAQAALGRSRKRAGPPDQEHHWRFNGKGWFTRPQWNGDRCPEGSQATHHNTCIDGSASDSDKLQYRKTRNTEFYGRPDSDKGQEFHSKLKPRAGGAINWDHPNGPQIYEPWEDMKPRPLPDNPEHLGPSLVGTRHKPYGSRSDARREAAKLVKHYTAKGFDPSYVKSAVRSRQNPRVFMGTLPGTSEKLPKDPVKLQRTLRKLAKAQDRQYRADNPETEDPHEMYAPWEMDDQYERRAYRTLDREHYNRPENAKRYPNDPGYPGHPDWPDYDAHGASHDLPDPYADRDWDGSSSSNEPPEPVDDVGSSVTGPHHCGQPRWPRTGERPDTHGHTNARFSRSRRSGR